MNRKDDLFDGESLTAPAKSQPEESLKGRTARATIHSQHCQPDRSVTIWDPAGRGGEC